MLEKICFSSSLIFINMQFNFRFQIFLMLSVNMCTKFDLEKHVRRVEKYISFRLLQIISNSIDYRKKKIESVKTFPKISKQSTSNLRSVIYKYINIHI